ncbi:5-formyltetrahydrofolate cyclo-ligase [Candidatus Marsarchaeota G2 archaeon ECH_B_SAG-G06]|uniref:5-formyltetrahydrofolate cyclo-ligase n=1 Tax=Candidatus Marsarchaeota G2 archaeon ECH_B_SAG-G06 TaxID=1978166 RepID=A0A2R6C389_9ARCH|nr:MAG: 5-formyltetrahydrofolate cyclo-ligase [Candidatus Marsarchaeota G2 archaeon ECH_B_SAG-G06]
MSEQKQKIRESVWKTLVQNKALAFPFKAYGAIPNFKGSNEAARLVCLSKEFLNASVVKVNPDSPQTEVRKRCLLQGKKLVMPTPRLKQGFVLIDPSKLDSNKIAKACTIAGALKYGKIVHPEELPQIELIVVGSVAVSKDGARVGKGEGYAELEYAILRTYKKVTRETPIFSSVHELQLVEWIPVEPFDFTLDAFFTPKRRFDVTREKARPEGVLWELLPQEKIRDIPLLKELYNKL